MLRPTAPSGEWHDYWDDRTIGSYLSESAQTAPDAIAIVEGRTRLTYSDLLRSVQEFAGGLKSIGVQRGDVVSIILPNWWEAAVAMHAVTWMGAVVNPIVPIYRHAELSFIFRQAKTRAVIVPAVHRNFDYVTMLREVREQLDLPLAIVIARPESDTADDTHSWLDVATGSEPEVDEDAAASEVAMLLYTSGTTAEPKGVLHTHQTIGWEMRSIVSALELGPKDSIFMPSPVGHLTGAVYGVYLPTTFAQSATLLDIWDPRSAVDAIESENCTFGLGAPTFLRGILEEYAHRGVTPSLTSFLCGGTDVAPQLIRDAQQRLGGYVSRCYGMTEMPVFSLAGANTNSEIGAETDGLPVHPGRFRIENGVGNVGELVIDGPERFVGYLDPVANADAFTPDGFFRTGDIAEIDDRGAISIVGRKKDIIIRGGENISAAEVEAHLLDHPGIQDVAVVPVPDPVMGERVCAFVVPRGTEVPTVQGLFDFLRAKGLAAQKCPERIELIEELPRTPSGKVQKFLLRQTLQEMTDE